MDLPGGYRRDPGGGDLGIYCLRHQQPRPARAGADHGRRDVQSPLYLGKGDFNVPALFTAVLELCFAGIAAVILNSWLQRKPKVTRTRAVRVSPIPMQSIAPTQPMAPTPPTGGCARSGVGFGALVGAHGRDRAGPRSVTPAAATAQTTSPAGPSPGKFWSPPEPPPQPKAAAPPPAPKAKPSKPKPPKEIYYNIVGEPINPTEDD